VWSSFWGVESDLDSESESERELLDSDEDEDLALLDFLLLLACFFECFLYLEDLAAFFAAFSLLLVRLEFPVSFGYHLGLFGDRQSLVRSIHSRH